MRRGLLALRTLAAVSSPADSPDFAPYVSFQEFQTGLPRGLFHVVVSPSLAPGFVLHITRARQITLAILGMGVALALTGSVLGGGVLVALGIVGNRLVKRQAGPLLIHLACRSEMVYTEATTHGVMEVRRVA